jgi:hypothetical protein
MASSVAASARPGEATAAPAAPLATFAGYIPLAAAYARRNWPRRMTADAIPAHVVSTTAGA